MSETTRMRSLKTKDNKDLTPEAIIDILDSFMNDPLIYNPEINVANMSSSRKPKSNHIFSPDIFAKTFSRENYVLSDFRRLMAENKLISIAIAAFDEEDTERVSIATVTMTPGEISIIFNVFDDKNIPDLEALLERVS